MSRIVLQQTAAGVKAGEGVKVVFQVVGESLSNRCQCRSERDIIHHGASVDGMAPRSKDHAIRRPNGW